MRRVLILVLTLTVGGIRMHAGPSRFAGTPAAQAEFAKGKTLEASNEWEQAALAYKRAWTIDPEFADAHDAYSWARQRQALGDISKLGKMTPDERKSLHERTKAMDDAVNKEYDDLIAAHPNAPIYKWAQAQHYNESNIDLQGKLCKETTEMDPAFTPGYRCLATVALVRGDFDVAADSWRHVMKVDGESPELWLRLVRSEREVPAKYKALTEELVAHLPHTDTAAQALELWAESLPVPERIAAFERLIAEYPPQQFKSTTDGAMWLFTLYDDAAPAKAAELAHRISAALPQDTEWQAKAAYCDTLAEAEGKADTDGAAALALLKKVKVPSYVSKQRLLLATARAQDRAGQLDAAYGDLLKAYAPLPGPKLETALYAYGRRLNRDAATVDKEVWALRTAAAKPATPFSLESFVDGKPVSLSDFKGRVVLLDFWFPNCGPCRGSFPLLERLYAKHKSEGLVYLGVNGLEDQNPQVMPLWKSLGWSFTPLKATEKWSDEVYGVTGYPTTFFIGADQRTYFKTHVYDENTFAIADMQLTALLKAAKTSPGAVQTGAQPVEYRSASGVEYRSLPDTDAITTAKAAVAADPRNVAKLIDLGVAQSGARQFREAIAAFTKGLEIEPNNALLLRWRGHRYLSVREFDKGFADLTRGSGIDPSIYGIWYHLGILQYVRGDFSAAAASFARAQPIAPDAGELAGSTDWLWMSLNRAGRGAEAKAMLDRRPETRLGPVTNAYTRRLQLYRGEIAPDAVITAADTDDVQIATLAYGLGNWYLTRGDKAHARAAFERSVQTTGGWPGFGFILSEVELKRIH